MIVQLSVAAVLGAVVALNPQPEPPGVSAHVSGYVIVALNPQPEPPGAPAPKYRDYVSTRLTVLAAGTSLTERQVRFAISQVIGRSARRGDVALNPQPEPPGIATDARVYLPPGPCRGVLVTIVTDGGRRPITTHAADTAEKGVCAFDVATPGAKAGSTAAVKFSRAI